MSTRNRRLAGDSTGDLFAPAAIRLAPPGATGRILILLASPLRPLMTAGPDRFDAIRRAVLPALMALIVTNFLGYAILGSNGLLKWSDYRRLKTDRMVEFVQLDAERTRLAHHSELLDPLRADPDFADEMIRTQLGLVRPDEVIIPIGDGP